MEGLKAMDRALAWMCIRCKDLKQLKDAAQQAASKGRTRTENERHTILEYRNVLRYCKRIRPCLLVAELELPISDE